jgi:NAD(P)-dependent dehydrogenase (short-subunit alcohol dehydrogenase family)
MPERLLHGKNILLTGASRGLGRAIAQTLWQNGANLMLIARSDDALQSLCDELMTNAEAEQRAYLFAADLAKSDAVPNILQVARCVWDRIDVLINNAATLGPIGKAWENDWDAWQMALRVDLLAPIELCRACVLWMLEKRRGKIINLSGGGATSPRPNFSAYATAKAAVVRFSETLADEVRAANIQVNCIAPGAMNTEMTEAVLRAGAEQAGEKEYAQAQQQIAGGASPQRAAELCVWLASPASDGITGKLISAVWDPWDELSEHIAELQDSDIYTLRRVVPSDRGKDWK